MSQGQQPEVESFPFSAWFCSLPQTGKALVDDCGLTLQTRRGENALKREKFQVPVAVHGSETSVLKLSNISNVSINLILTDVFFSQ